MFTGIVEELGTVKSCERLPRTSLSITVDGVVNIELDIVAKQIERLLEPYRP